MHKARNTLIPVTFALLASLSMYIFIFLEVQKAGSEVETSKQHIKEEEEKARKREAVQKTIIETNADRSELESRLLEKDGLVNFFEDIEELAKESGVEMEIAKITEDVELDLIIPKAATAKPIEGVEAKPADTKPVKDPASNLLNWLQMDVSATGSWQKVYQFLTLIELLPYEIRLDNIHLETSVASRQVSAEEGAEGPSAVTGPDVWELSFTMKVLKLKPVQ